MCQQRLLHHRRAGKAMETGTGVFSCKPAVGTNRSAPHLEGLKEPLLLLLIRPEELTGAKELFDMAQLHRGLIFPNHPITSLGIRGFWSPQQLSRQGLHTAFPYRSVLCSAAASHQTSPQVATVPYSQGCSFLPSFTLMASTRKDTNN